MEAISDKSISDKASILGALAKKISLCHRCPLSENRCITVPGAGNPDADIMFVGEGPGKKEDETGIPFVGAAGRFLDELLNLIQLRREDIFITNIVKCRPPGNRDPLPEEVKMCLPFLRKQTSVIKPKIICTLGNWASRTLLEKPQLAISAHHGAFVKKKGMVFCLLYHPAAALYNGSLKDTLRNDFIRLGLYLKNLDSKPSCAD